MNLALVLGQNGDSIKSKLISVKDNLNIECFTSLQHFINDAIKRDLYFDRVIMLSTLIKNNSYIDDLYNYWNMYSRDSEIVLLCRKTNDDDLAKIFLGKFCSISVTSMSVTSTTLHTLTEAVVLPISSIIDKYGISDYLNVEVEDDSYESEPVEEKKVNESSMEKPIPNNPVKEKRSLFGALFGKKKKSQVQQNVEKPNMTQPSMNIAVTPEDYGSTDEVDDNDYPSTEQNEESSQGYDSLESTDEYQEDVVDENLDNVEEEYENYDVNNSISSSADDDDVSDDFYDSVEEIEEDSSGIEPDFINEEVENGFYEEPKEGGTQDTEPDFINENFEDVDNDFDFSEQLPEEVDEDFGDLTLGEGVEPVEDITSAESIEEVTDEEVLVVGSAEEEYRKNTEKPKVIEKTVVKEVIKNVKTSSVLENVYKGAAHKLVIVTGDRGSGVTTTAWSLACHFSQKVPVLYFDCDTINHGLLNYIDYFEFKNYEQSHMQGVKLCRNSRAFSSCACKWDTNMDILTSDFGVEVEDDDLILAQGIVAENLNKYGVVIVDCPLTKLPCVQDLILTGNVVLCMEDSKRGYMNALLSLDSSKLPLRYKRSIISKGTLVRTKINPKNDYKRLLKYINSIVDLEDCNWFEMVTTEFTGKVTNDLLTEILEG